MASEFHWRDNIYFRATDDGNVDVFKRPKRVAYWTQDKGFHDPEEPLFTVDGPSWKSIVSFIDDARNAVTNAIPVKPQGANGIAVTPEMIEAGRKQPGPTLIGGQAERIYLAMKALDPEYERLREALRKNASIAHAALSQAQTCPLGEMHGCASTFARKEDGVRCCDFCGRPVQSQPQEKGK